MSKNMRLNASEHTDKLINYIIQNYKIKHTDDKTLKNANKIYTRKEANNNRNNIDFQ